MVTGVFPCPPGILAFIFIALRVQHVPTFQPFCARGITSDFALSRSRAFGLSICKKEPLIEMRTYDLNLNSYPADYWTTGDAAIYIHMCDVSRAERIEATVSNCDSTDERRK